MKQQIQIATSTIALVALLAYTFVHTGALLARYVAPPLVGYIAAFGIETAVVGLSLRIGDMRRAKQRGTGFFIFVLLAVAAVSAMANIAEGFYAINGAMLSKGNLSQLDPIQAIILLAATGLISLIVLALSEIIGTDISIVIKRAEREQRKEQAQIAPEPAPERPEPAQGGPERYECEDCARSFATVQAINAHRRHCRGVPVKAASNGIE